MMQIDHFKLTKPLIKQLLLYPWYCIAIESGF